MTELFLDRERGPGYDCFDFAREVWAHLTGEDLRVRFHGMVQPKHLRSVTILEQPESPCLVLLRRDTGESHLGVWWNNALFHLTNYGAALQPREIAFIGFVSSVYFK